MENPIKMDDLGVPLFLETPISIQVPTKCLYSLLAYVLKCNTDANVLFESSNN